MFTEQQKKVVEFEQGNLLVSASAGSGKTTVMIERLTRLVAEGKAKVSEILAITFTESAAAEMKERLKKEITKKINEGAKALEKELNEIRIADICTIDGYCSRLIRSNFFEAGVSPDYEIADKNRADALKEEALNTVFNAGYKEKGEFIKFVDRFAVKRSDNSLKGIILKILEFLSTEPDEEEAVKKYISVPFQNLLDKAFACIKSKLYVFKEKLEDCLISAKDLKLEKGGLFIEDLLTDINGVIEGKNIYSFKAMQTKGRRLSFDKTDDATALSVKAEVQDVKKHIVALYDTYMAYLADEDKTKGDYQNALSTAEFLFKTALKVKEEYDKLKREENLLDFCDLEHFALKVLENEKVLKAVKSKYKYVFVDEYQDVNGTEEAVITKIADGNLFSVGDEKQSIYGFRGCRPEFFESKFEKMEKDGEATIRLNNNFRSSNAVINMVNEIFAFSMTKKTYGLDYDKDARLISGDKYGDHKGRATLHLLLKEEKEQQEETPRIYDIKEEIAKLGDKEDNLTVSMLVKIINEELGQEYYDVKNEKVKKVCKGDICILCRSGKGEYAEQIIKGLISHGISVSANTEEDVCLYPEVQSVINVIRLIDCFYQDAPLLSVLKSYIVGLTENQLCDIVDYFKANFKDNENLNKYNFTFSDAFEYYIGNASGTLHDKLISFKDYIDKTRFTADFLSAGELLEKITEDFSLKAFLYAEEGGDVKVERLERIISYAYENSLSVSAFVKVVDSGEKKITLVSGGDENSVKFMTIHASKGLEFPVVIVCGLEKPFNREDLKQEVFFDREFGIIAKTYDDENRTVEENMMRTVGKDVYLSKTEKEELRLFYVALTRASYALHMTAICKEDKREDKFYGAKGFIDFVPKYVNTRILQESDLAFVNKTEPDRKVLISQSNETGIKEMQKTFAFKYPFTFDTMIPLKSSVTEANQNSHEGVVYELNKTTETETDALKGIIAHRIMQYYDYSGKNFDQQIKDMLSSNIVTEQELKSIDLKPIEKVLTSEFFLSLKEKTTFREKEFVCSAKACDIMKTLSEKQVLMQGVIDLLVIDNGVAEIVDYKYSGKSADRLKEDYKKQLQLYAYATESILGIPVKSKSIVSLLSGERIEID